MADNDKNAADGANLTRNTIGDGAPKRLPKSAIDLLDQMHRDAYERRLDRDLRSSSDASLIHDSP